ATEGRSVLFVSHQMAAIQNLCTRCLLMERGQITHAGRTADVVSTYLSRAAALTTTSIAERTDRQGRGRIRIEEVELLDEDGRPVQEAASGSTFVIRAHFAVTNGQTLRNCSIRLSVHRSMRPYFVVGTDLIDRTPLDLSGRGSIDFTVPDWPL